MLKNVTFEMNFYILRDLQNLSKSRIGSQDQIDRLDQSGKSSSYVLVQI